MKKKYYLLSGICGIMITAALSMPFLVNAKTEKSDVIPQGVYAGEISLGGMTEEEASRAVERVFEDLQSKKVTLKAGNNKVETTAGALGLSWGNPEIIEESFKIGSKGNLLVRYKELKDLEYEGKVYDLAYVINKGAVSKLLEQNETTLNTEAVDAEITRKDGAFEIKPETQGVAVDVEKSADKVEEFFQKEWTGNDVDVELVADVVDPKATQAELAKVKDVLGSYETNYGNASNAGRRQNVENGASKINGSVVFPGEQFSVYELTSPFEISNGYAVGGAYENGKLVDSIGGGICQVSTTLYNAVIRAELKIVERYPHSMTVTYVKPSEDAAIAGTYKDLKFVNNTDAPIYIEGYTGNSIIGFNVYGQETRPKNRSVDFVSEVLSTTDPGVQYQAVGDQPIGYMSVDQGAHVGYTARLWKIVTVDGVETEREIFNTSTYKPSAKIVLVGVGTGNPEAAAAIGAAIGTQDEATIQAAMAQWNDAALQQAAEQAAQQQQQQEEQQEQQNQDKNNKDKNNKDKNNKDKNNKDKDDEGDDSGDKKTNNKKSEDDEE